jgi:hypothetical protein
MNEHKAGDQQPKAGDKIAKEEKIRCTGNSPSNFGGKCSRDAKEWVEVKKWVGKYDGFKYIGNGYENVVVPRCGTCIGVIKRQATKKIADEAKYAAWSRKAAEEDNKRDEAKLIVARLNELLGLEHLGFSVSVSNGVVASNDVAQLLVDALEELQVYRDSIEARDQWQEASNA